MSPGSRRARTALWLATSASPRTNGVEAASGKSGPKPAAVSLAVTVVRSDASDFGDLPTSQLSERCVPWPRPHGGEDVGELQQYAVGPASTDYLQADRQSGLR